MKKNPVEYVNPLIGTNSKKEFSHGNIYPEITLPFGMACWTPQTGKKLDGWIYQYENEYINGIKLTHQPSPWISDYGDFAIMPVICKPDNLKVSVEDRKSKFNHDRENAHPYYYKVNLDNEIQIEVSPTERCGYLKITYPDLNEEQNPYLIFDNWNIGEVTQISKTEILGTAKNSSGGVPDNFACYLKIEFNKSVDFVKSEEGAYAFLIKNLDKDRILEFKIATSFICPEQTEINFINEIESKSFKEIKHDAFEAWNSVLSKIQIDGASEDQLKTFYSCFYRTQLYPRKFYEYDKNNNIKHYSPYNGKIEKGKLFTDNGPWDTYRTVYPFYSFMFPNRIAEMIDSWIKAYKEGGWFPKWSSPGYRECMIGTPIVNLIADAVCKGITDFDIKSGYEGALKDATDSGGGAGFGKVGLDDYNELGYVPMIKIKEACSRTLEFSYNDFNLAIFAKYLGRKDDYQKYIQRSKNYKNVFDHSDKFMKGRYSDGTWEKGFDPIKWGGCGLPYGGPYTEGNSWHYTFAVPFDPKGLIELMGGDEAFINKLDDLLDSSNNKFDNEYYGYDIHEMHEMVTCNMGQYQHSNQPVHHLLYLYNYAGTPWKAAPHLRQVMDTLYGYDENGFCGDEDNGEMAAWYLMSSLGFYPVCPGSAVPRYEIGTPRFKKVTLNLEKGEELNLVAYNNSDKNIYVQSVKVNGQKIDRSWLKHEEIITGGLIEFEMGDTPNKEWGESEKNRPPSFV